jgi:hypothetical protein
MRIKIYMTEGAQGSEGGSVTLLVPEGHLGDLPSHPNGGTWSYLAVIETEGRNSVQLTGISLRAISLQGFYIRRMSDDE